MPGAQQAPTGAQQAPYERTERTDVRTNTNTVESEKEKPKPAKAGVFVPVGMNSEEFEESVKTVLDALNQANSAPPGFGCKTKTDSYRRLLGRIFQEGHTVSDVIKVIRHRHSLWIVRDNKTMAHQMVPSVLFSKKHFDEYLAQAEPWCAARDAMMGELASVQAN